MTERLYRRVAERIIEELAAGRLPWVTPWASGCAVEPATNAVSRRAYSGVNAVLLWEAASRRGYTCNRWMTFAQARIATDGVRRGESGTTIVFAREYVPRIEQERVDSGEIQLRDATKRFHLRSYRVFNLDQLVDVPAKYRPAAPATTGKDNREVEELLRKTGAEIRVGGTDAYFNHAEDFVALPGESFFAHRADFYATALHEMIHWTGHETRLDRSFGQSIRDSAYVREELIAELGGAFLCARFGIQPQARHSDYIGHWLEAINAEPRALFRSASAASAAADYLIAFTQEGQDSGEPRATDRYPSSA